MFNNTVIAEGFPIPKRGQETGVELPFEAMVKLGRVLYQIQIPNGIVLKGYSTILVPIGQTSSQSVQWHLIVKDEPNARIRIDEISKNCSAQILDLDIDELRKSRTFVGFCKNVCIHVGAHDSGYEQADISGADENKGYIQIGRWISASIGTSSMGFFSFIAAIELSLARGLSLGPNEESFRIKEQLLNSRDHPLLLYDVEKRTGCFLKQLVMAARRHRLHVIELSSEIRKSRP